MGVNVNCYDLKINEIHIKIPVRKKIVMCNLGRCFETKKFRDLEILPKGKMKFSI